MHQPFEETVGKGILSDEEIPENAGVFIFGDNQVKLFVSGELDEDTYQAVHSVYRLVSYCSGSGSEISRRVDAMIGRVN